MQPRGRADAFPYKVEGGCSGTAGRGLPPALSRIEDRDALALSLLVHVADLGFSERQVQRYLTELVSGGLPSPPNTSSRVEPKGRRKINFTD